MVGSGRETDIFNYIVRIRSSGASSGNNKWNIMRIKQDNVMPVRGEDTVNGQTVSDPWVMVYVMSWKSTNIDNTHEVCTLCITADGISQYVINSYGKCFLMVVLFTWIFSKLTGTCLCAKVQLQIEVFHHVAQFTIVRVFSKLANKQEGKINRQTLVLGLHCA